MTQTLTTKVPIISAGTGGHVVGIRCGPLRFDTVRVDGGGGRQVASIP